MANTIGAWSYYNDKDGSVSQTNSTISSSLSSTKGNDSKSKTTLDVDDFLQLLVAEMQNQDPLEPTDNSQYMAQMATFSQVEATAEMNESVEKQSASNLVGKTVIMTTKLNNSGYIAGKVDYWEKIDGTVYLGIGGKLYDIADLDTVMDDDYYKKWADANSGTTDSTTDSDKTDNSEKETESADKA